MSRLLHKVPRKVGEWSVGQLGGLHAYFDQTFSLTGDAVDEWTDESGNGLDLTPLTTSPTSDPLRFGGHRGVYVDEFLALADEKTFARPWEWWFVLHAGSLAGAQDLIQNNAQSDIVRLTNTGAIQVRIGAAFKTVAGGSSIVAGTRYVIGIWSDAAGNIECEINGTVQGQGQSSTSDFAIRRVGDDGAAMDSHLGAIALFDGVNLDAWERAVIRERFDDFRRGGFHVVGASNSIDAIQGYRTIGGVHFSPLLSTEYNSKPIIRNGSDLNNWHGQIGNFGVVPWSTFRRIADKSDADGYEHLTALWLHLMLSGFDAEDTWGSTEETKLTEVVDAARGELVTQGHFAAADDCPLYISPMALYGPSSTCGADTQAGALLSVDGVAWAVANLANCSAGPILPTLTEFRSDVGGGTGACHVAESWKKDDGLALQGLFDGLEV